MKLLISIKKTALNDEMPTAVIHKARKKIMQIRKLELNGKKPLQSTSEFVGGG